MIREQRAEVLDQIVSKLSLSHRDLEQLLIIHGLDETATAWIMYAYVNGDKDDASYKKVLLSIFETMILECELEMHIADGISRLAIDECFDGRDFSIRQRASILKVSKSTLDRKQGHFFPLIEKAKQVIDEWEKALIVTAKKSGHRLL